MKPYRVKEIFYTLQGEGIHAGRPSIFLRFSGCNLWSGLEEDRGKAICRFCDTDFQGTDGVNGGTFASPVALAERVRFLWPRNVLGFPFVVCTGGEPLLQLDHRLVEALQAQGFEVAIETNGTQMPPTGVDWICVSPKAGASLKLTSGDELKLVYPQAECDPAEFLPLKFNHFLLQPMDGPNASIHLKATIAYCLSHPIWRLSLQTHKLIGLP